jgi:hypothetical protein
MADSRKEYLREQFIETYGEEPETLLDDHEPSERDLELALAMDRDKFTSIAVIVQAEQTLDDVDLEHLSGESQDEIRELRAKMRFSKKVEMAKFDMPWDRIRDLFVSGQYDALEEAYDEDWDAEDLMEWEVDDDR